MSGAGCRVSGLGFGAGLEAFKEALEELGCVVLYSGLRCQASDLGLKVQGPGFWVRV